MRVSVHSLLLCNVSDTSWQDFAPTGVLSIAFCALTLLAGRQEEHPVSNKLLECGCGYLSEMMCRLFAYGPADATASHNLLPHLNPDWFYLSCTGLPWLSWKRGS